jgi:hypothetical protein
MSVSIALQLATLLVTVVIGVCVVYASVEMRKMYVEQREKLARATFAVEEFEKLRAEAIVFLRRVESDGHALQKIASQIEVAVAELKQGVSSATLGAAERQTAAIDTLRDQMDAQEQRLATIAETISEGLKSFSAPRETASEEPHETTNQSRLRREALSQNPVLRFEVLREWVSINTLAILHRASRPWNTAKDLIAHIPPYLEAEAEILNHSILLIATRQHSERLAIPLRELSSSSNYRLWFEPPRQGQSTTHSPAILMRSNGHFKLVTKGIDSTGIPNPSENQ